MGRLNRMAAYRPVNITPADPLRVRSTRARASVTVQSIVFRANLAVCATRQDVTAAVELASRFDPDQLIALSPAAAFILTELLSGPPRSQRSLSDLARFTGLKTPRGQRPRLRLSRLELRRVAVAVHRAFTALEFEFVGRRVTAVCPLGLSLLEDPA